MFMRNPSLWIVFSIASLLSFFLSPSLVFSHETIKEDQRIVHMNERGFDPQHIIIDRNVTIIFENTDKKDHWPASNIHPTHDIYPEFDPTKPIKPGESWQFTFEQAGEWRFHDHLYPTVSGKIDVKRNGTTTASTKTTKPVRGTLKDQLKRFFIDTKATLLLAYFRIFPEDLEKHYLPDRSLARIARQKNDKLLSYIIKTIGPEKAMKKLFDESGQGSKFNCHTPSHQIGRISYEILRAEALEKNITLCHSGYIHGVMAAFVKSNGSENLAVNISEICKKAKTSFGRLTCFHGIGHGLMAYYDNDLPVAINTCRELASTFAQNNCLVGTFMENIASVIGDSLSPHKSTWVKSQDPHFPCNAIDQTPQVQSTCYAIQPGWMRHIYNHDNDRVVQACLSAQGEAIESCFFGYGQVIAASIPKDKPDQMLSLCEKVPKRENYFDQCLIGAQAVIMDFWGPNMTNQGEQFCNILPKGNKETCIDILDRRLQDLGKARS